MQTITIYSKDTCPYCVRAKELLKQRNAHTFNEIRIDLDDDKREEMIARTGRKTVPQIFIGEFHVGGFDDLVLLDKSGKLTALLANPES